jgi:RND family efflux transporter MFP subunit
MSFIKNTWKKFRAWWGRQRLLVRLGIIIAIIIVAFMAFGKGKAAPTIETVLRQDLVRTVSATGAVTSTTDLALSFQQNGMIADVRVEVGDTVVKGQILATLSAGDERASVTSAQGALLAAQAREKKVVEGSSDTEVQKATVALENARRALYSEGLVAQSDDNLAASDRDPIITGVYRSVEEGSYRIYFESSTNEVRYSGLERGAVTVSKTPMPLGTRGLMVSFPENRSTYSIGDSWRVLIPNTSAAAYTANLNEYRSAEAELESVKAKARSADVDIAHADVVSAQGQVQAAQAALEKTIIRAPAGGTVTKVDINPGDLAESFESVITVQDIGHLYIEADVNESDVSHIAVGQPISITYDAFGKATIYQATVSSIDLAPTVVDGIVNYKLKAQIADATNVRPGMTANLSVQTAFMPDVLVIPDRTITEKDGVQTVEVLVDERDQTTETRTITTGLHGDGGLVEVTSGLSVGERLIFTAR